MKVVEDLEEDFLGTFFLGEELHIVYDQHIEVLIEVDELVVIALFGRINELIDEFFGTHENHHFLFVGLFDEVANGMGQVGFAQSTSAEYHEGVECGSAGLLSDGQTCISCQFVAIAFHKIVERVAGIELAIDVHSFQAGDDERVFDGRIHVDGHAEFILYRLGRIAACWQVDCVRCGIVAWSRGFHDDVVFQLGGWTDDFL